MLKLRLSLESKSVRGRHNELYQACEAAWKEIARFYPDPEAQETWTFGLDDREAIQRATDIYNRFTPDFAKPIYQVLVAPGLSPEIIDSSDFFVVGIIGDDASGLHAYESAEVGDWRQNVYECLSCGNSCQDPNFEFGILGKKLPKTKVLFSFFSKVSVFCRPEFVELYEAEQLTGLTFNPIDRGRTDGVELFKVNFHPHQWRDSDGVCEDCGMKTNVRSFQFFNLLEEYPFDFQVVTVYRDHVFVVSKRAAEFLRTCSHFEFEYCRCPILPGFMIDELYPEPKIFAHSEYPTQALRWDLK